MGPKSEGDASPLPSHKCPKWGLVCGGLYRLSRAVQGFGELWVVYRYGELGKVSRPSYPGEGKVADIRRSQNQKQAAWRCIHKHRRPQATISQPSPMVRLIVLRRWLPSQHNTCTTTRSELLTPQTKSRLLHVCTRGSEHKVQKENGLVSGLQDQRYRSATKNETLRCHWTDHQQTSGPPNTQRPNAAPLQPSSTLCSQRAPQNQSCKNTHWHWHWYWNTTHL